jgi:chromosome partitioning protein
MTHIIAVLNQKGGVGKTTTAINLSSYLAKTGKTVLLVDLDPQGNATSGLGLQYNETQPGTYELLLGQVELEGAVQESPQTGLYVLPTTAKLAAAEVELVSANGREQSLKKGLSQASYDYVLIDCPPSLGLLTINALTAADKVLIPVQAEYYALEGLSQLLNVIQRVRQGLNAGLDLLGVVLTMYDSRTMLSEQVLQEVKKHFTDKVFTTVVPRNVRLAEAPSYGRSIFEHDKWSKGARAYKQLAKEVMQRVGQ